MLIFVSFSVDYNQGVVLNFDREYIPSLTRKLLPPVHNLKLTKWTVMKIANVYKYYNN